LTDNLERRERGEERALTPLFEKKKKKKGRGKKREIFLNRREKKRRKGFTLGHPISKRKEGTMEKQVGRFARREGGGKRVPD